MNASSIIGGRRSTPGPSATHRSMTAQMVEAVEITVHKPEADLGVPFDDVVVMIRRERAA